MYSEATAQEIALSIVITVSYLTVIFILLLLMVEYWEPYEILKKAQKDGHIKALPSNFLSFILHPSSKLEKNISFTSGLLKNKIVTKKRQVGA